MQLLLSFTIKY